MAETIDNIEVLVAAKRPLARGVVLLELREATGGDLPEWAPGAHIDILLPQGLTRQYSLCGERDDRKSYRVAVLKLADGRGGSAYVHDVLAPDQRILISHPRNHFHFALDQRHLFIAGGIGITPLLSMMAEASARGFDWSLWYGGRSRQSMAFAHELVERYGNRVNLWPQDEKGHLPLGRLAQGSRDQTGVYCCGPERLLDAAAEHFSDLPAGAFNIERFAPKSLGQTENGEFIIELAKTGSSLPVPSDRTIMDVLIEAGIPILSSCREGTCGTCEVAVLEGRIDHRDSILTQEEQDANDTMMICVSRALSKRLVLDL